MTEPEVTAIIPVFNDHRSLEIAIPRSIELLSRITNGFELVIAEDGSTDGSAELVHNYEQQDPRIHLLHSDERLGRGKALTRAINKSSGKIVCYYDVDLATDMQHLPELIGAIRDGADIWIKYSHDFKRRKKVKKLVNKPKKKNKFDLMVG